ncbi:glycosyltransferase [Pedomonas mirosovicensis]|uniref:glycosyltransferase n=1 Tax=Pedomonas mirosovicensis TaxID=2908641 RepID=UPI0021672288|nr:glycosyltransferase [Pedomonas mirosovicensis]MCH8684819.1 glycosyltransferase [Pedomonas mirosovicensis]
MKVLVFSTLYPSAAQPNFGIFVENAVRQTAASGIETRVIAPNGVPPWPLSRHARYAATSALPLREEWRGLDVLRPRFPLLPSIGWRFNPGFIARAGAAALRQLMSEGFVPDVIDAQFFYPCGVAAVQVARRFDLPVTVKARGSDIALWGQRPLARRMMLEAARQADSLTAVSAALKGEMASLGMSPQGIDVHYTAVDLERFAPGDRAAAKVGHGFVRPTIVSVGSLTDVKDHALLIRAMVHVPEASLAIAGHGPLRPNLEALAAELGLGTRVRFLGAISHDVLPSLYQAADVFALTSKREGLANVWIESLACGTPLVITAAGGAREVVDRPEAGRVVESRTPEAVAAALKALLAAPPPADAVRACAERFTWRRHVEAKLAILTETIERHRRRAG